MRDTDATDATYGGPLTLDPISKKGRLGSSQLASVVAGPDDDLKDIQFRLKNYVARGYLHPAGRDQDDGRGLLVYEDWTAIAAAVLIEVTTAQLKNVDALAKVGFALRTWRPPLPQGLGLPGAPESPIEFVWRTYLDNPDTPPGFSLHVGWQRHVETGRRDVQAALWHDPHGYLGPALDLREGWYPTATMILPLDPLLPRLRSRIQSLRSN